MRTTKDPNTLEHEATLADYRGRWLVLFFYPADFTFLCPTEVLAFNAAASRLADDHDAELLGVSTDSVFSHIAWMEFHIGMLDFPLASDRTHEVSRAYDVLAEGESARAVFIIDPDGIVRYEVVHDDKVGRSVDEVLRVLAALQSEARTFAQFGGVHAVAA